MIIYENDCVGCETCRCCGASHHPVLVCDECEDAPDILYEYGNKVLCKDCLLEAVSSECVVIRQEDVANDYE